MNSCCGDVEGELIIGNIKENSIGELWFGKRAREIRKLHTTLDFDSLKVCQVCSGINADWYKDAFEKHKEVYQRLDPSREVISINNASALVK